VSVTVNNETVTNAVR